MTSRGKKIFLALSIIVPFVIYCVIYYAPIIRNAPFKAKEFVSLEYKWGAGNNLENSYNSATGEYRYYNNEDSLIVTKVMLTERDKKFLDSNADEQGFWNLPDVVANDENDLKNSKAVRYFMKFNYETKSKEVTYLSDFNGNPKMKDAAAQMQKIIEQSIIDAEEKAKK
ncbi:hypothetical protein EZ428_21875 [Pedobacter frigiditerrae]|uniref:Uncharacterized protein n=1 Tax=Pedobacter frigiditerrae TaxID=2530452 RepID=A0A4R0ML25_9SPHI|nr:hypothetical protein [Pedobacter frigiditerrae]TCC87348.1 hypothetical protein EZ428_21875 [Pedobacter frigiditerrae]